MTIERREIEGESKGILVICHDCKDRVLTKIPDSIRVNESWARGVAEFHDTKYPDHLIVIYILRLMS